MAFLIGICCFIIGALSGGITTAFIAGASKNNMCEDCLYKETYKKEKLC